MFKDDPRGRLAPERRPAIALVLLLAAALALGSCAAAPASAVHPGPGTVAAGQPGTTDWPTFGFDAARGGVNPAETHITAATVGALRLLWRAALPDVADSSPTLLHAVRLANGATRELLYVTTRDGRLLALDAANGATRWSHQPRGPKITHSSAVADPARQVVYAYGLDGGVHQYQAGTGAEVTGGGWPAPITRMTETEKESSALNLADGRVYATTSGYIGDATPYQGHVVAITAAGGTARVFNSLCSNVARLLAGNDCTAQRSGIWARGGAVIDPTTGAIFVATGNGPFNANSGGADYGDSVLELAPDGSRLLDSYTPSSYQRLEDTDADLGSAAPALLPPLPASATPSLLVQAGKDAKLRLLDRRNLSGAGGPGHVGGELQTVDFPGCGVFTQPAVWSDPARGDVWVFVAGSCGFAAYTVATDASGAPRLRQAWGAGFTASSPVLAGGVLFAATSGDVLALDPRTGKQLWSSTRSSAGGGIGGIHWESPIVVDGTLYISDENGNLSAYSV